MSAIFYNKIIFLSICIGLIFSFIPTVQATSLTKNPLTVINASSSVGTISWANPANASTSNNVYSTATGKGSKSTHYLKATNFQFNIPTDKIIDGIVVRIEKKADGIESPTVQDQEVEIVKNDIIGSENKANPNEWFYLDTYVTYGSSTDLWSEIWTPTDINSLNFGVVLMADIDSEGLNIQDVIAYVDHIEITVYYSDVPSVDILNGFTYGEIVNSIFLFLILMVTIYKFYWDTIHKKIDKTLEKEIFDKK